MDRNTIMGLVLIFAILIGYSIWMTPSAEEREAAQQRQDSILKVQREQDSIALTRLLERQKQDSIAASQEIVEEVTEAQSGEITGNVDRDKLGAFANSSMGENETFFIENDLLRIGISAKGGKVISVLLKEFQTYDSLPLYLFDSEMTNFGITFFASNRLINTNELYFRPGEAQSLTVSGEQTGSFSMRLHTDLSDSTYNPDSYIEYRYTLKGKDYMLDFDINFVGLEPFIDKGTHYLDLAWNTELNKLEKGRDRFNGPTIYYKFHEDEVDYLSEQKDDEEELVNRMKWVSFTHRFFSSTLIAKDYFLNANVKVFELEDQHDHYLRSMAMEIGLPFKGVSNESIPLAFYFGPNKYKKLRKYKLDLEQQIPLGWSFFLMQWINRYAVIPVFNYLEGFGWNYGIIILLLTIMLKVVLFPIAYKSYVSSAKMRALKPEIEELGKKFPKKEDAMKKQQATMDLYKKAGVNPMAGCIPMLLQFPILIAMFRFFPSAIELRQQSFLWADDLSSYDSILDLGFEIPFYGDHVSLFTLLMTVSTLIYTRMNQEMMGSQQQMPGMKTMMYLMPVMFLGLFNNYAAGLSYYYFLANIITFAQMFFIRKSINEDKIRKQIELNKKKPRKKSSWQKRLEDAAKQRGYKPPKK
jgi:YidC/Oxa1 family membrane protein insertase